MSYSIDVARIHSFAMGLFVLRIMKVTHTKHCEIVTVLLLHIFESGIELKMDESERVAKVMKVREVVKERDVARKEGNFIKADRLRETLADTYGVELIDQVNGPSGWKFRDGTSKKLPPGTVPTNSATKVKSSASGKSTTETVETSLKKRKREDDAPAAAPSSGKKSTESATKKAKPSQEQERNRAVASQLLGGGQSGKPAGRNVNGILIEDIKIGSGPQAQSGQRVKVNYVGRLKTNNKVFDSSTNPKKPFGFLLGRGEVITGWDIGVQGLRVGGTRRLTIPPEKAYGRHGAPPTIPPNATLVFDVTLIEVR